jgi:hypothetical protein
MDDGALLAEIDRRHARALPYNDYVGVLRARNIDYYQRREDGLEVDGRSHVVTSAVAETVDSIHAQIADFFDANDRPIEFEGATDADAPHAELANDLFKYIFYTQNKGTLIVDTSLKDGLLCKNGFAKVAWHEDTQVAQRRYAGLSSEEYQALALNPHFKTTQVRTLADGRYDVTGVETMRDARVRIDCVSPESVVIGEDARSPDIDDVSYLCHSVETTKEQLIAMGYAPERVQAIGQGDTTARYKPEQSARRFDGNRHEQSNEAVMLEDAYIKVDADGDGIIETLKVCRVGSTLLSKEMVRDIPFAAWCPKPMPHEFFGESPADEAVEFQERETAIWRETLDNIYLQNAPRVKALGEGEVNLDDLMNIRPGGVVRVTRMDAVEPLVSSATFQAQNMLALLESTKAEREQRTGVTRHNQGIDGASLSKTATGMQMMLSQSQLRTKQMARNYANLFLRRLAQLTLNVMAENKADAMTIIKAGKPMMIDPSVWNAKYNLRCTISLGTGTREQQLAFLQLVANAQKEAAGSGLMNVLVSPMNLYESAKQLTQITGLGGVSKYFSDPQHAQPQPPAPPPVDPLHVQQQIEQIKAQSQIQIAQVKTQASLQVQQQKMALEKAQATFDAQLKLEGLRLAHELETQRASTLLQVKQMEAPPPATTDEGERHAMLAALNATMAQLASAIGQWGGPKRIAIERDANGKAVGAVSVAL